MIALSGKILFATLPEINSDKVIRLSSNRGLPLPIRKSEIFILDSGEIPSGFWGYLAFDDQGIKADASDVPLIRLDSEMSHLADGDVIRISSNFQRIRVVYRAQSPHNFFLLTERCNHYCLMCSQPPKPQDDSYLIENIKDVLRLASRDSVEIGFTGGEPTILGEDFIDLVRLAESYLPTTSLHVLSNGRAFEDREYARKLGEIGHHDLMIGIPIYSDAPEIHNYVVQSNNALEETLRGLINLNRFDVQIEIRVVIHKITKDRLANLAEFISANLPFVSHVAFMGLEMTGFARANKELLWVEPDSYSNQLASAVEFLSVRNIRTSIYNLQMCLMPQEIWPFMERSISEWKNEYEPECENCVVKESCGGFFSSVIYKKPKNIRTLRREDIVDCVTTNV
jgi:His-Xaa-Ser system radical SAM maturase HxsC